jgi:hypothetical protein
MSVIKTETYVVSFDELTKASAEALIAAHAERDRNADRKMWLIWRDTKTGELLGPSVPGTRTNVRCTCALLEDDGTWREIHGPWNIERD